jgi:hypothetical protein
MLMQHRYVIQIDAPGENVIVKEYGELDREEFSLLCEESYEKTALEAAAQNGKDALIDALRTPNLYPVRQYAEKLAEAVSEVLASAPEYGIEILFDEKEMLVEENGD